MKNIVSVFIVCFLATASFAQQSFIHIHNYEWIDNQGVKMVEMIDDALAGEADLQTIKQLAKTLNHCCIKIGGINNTVSSSEQIKESIINRTGSYQNYEEASRKDPKWKEIMVSPNSSQRLQLSYDRMDKIADQLKENNFEILKTDQKFESNKALLSEFKEIYLECVDMLKGATL